MIRFFIVTVFLAFSINGLYAQRPSKRPNYKLLWKITGKNIVAPSYLFGTMHVYDSRAFDFSDSVLLKISECQAFSLEVHPDSTVNLILRKMFLDKKDAPNRFRELLSKKDYEELDSLIKNKTGYTLDKLKTPVIARMFLENRGNKRDKSTFVDAYLYNIARRQGKIILGLENIEQQYNMMEEEASNNVKEKLIYYLGDSNSVGNTISHKQMLDLYYKGDIEALRNYLKEAYQTDPSSYEKLITLRNVGMANNMEKEMKLHSAFFAVGAGHLPGEEGLISLLRQRGYTVSLVPPTFTGLAKKYKYETKPESWYSFTSDVGGYSIEMPSKPVPLNIDSLRLTFQMSLDLGTSVYYQSAFIPTANKYAGKSPKYIFDALESNYKKNKVGRVEKATDIIVEGLSGRELITINGSNIFKLRYILRGDIVYLLIAGSTREAIHSPDVQRFFKSFQVRPFLLGEWKEFINKDGAYKVNMSGEVKTQNVDTEGPELKGVFYHLKMSYSINPQKQETYIVRYNNFPNGYICLNDSTYYASLLDASYKSMKGINLSRKEVNICGFKGLEYTFNTGEDGLVKGQMVLRGNRFYLLMATSTKSQADSGINDFLQSFQFTDFLPSAFKLYNLDKEGSKIKFCSDYTIDTTDTESLNDQNTKKVYNSLDTNSGIQYILVKDKFSEYDQFSNKEAFFKAQNDQYLTVDDSILFKQEIIYKNQYLGQEIFIQSKIVNSIKKIRMILNGQYLYIMMIYVPIDLSKEYKPAIEFFNSLELPTKETWNLFDDKADPILKAIASSDTSVQQSAVTALSSHIFKNNDLQKLYSALKVSYSNDTLEYGSVKHKLLEKLKQTNDTSTLPFIKNYYLGLSGSALKSQTLSVLSELKDHSATEALVNFLLKDNQKKDFDSYLIVNPYFDSLQLSSSILSNITLLEPKFENSYWLLDLAKQALDSGVLSKEVEANVLKSILELANLRTSQPIKLEKNDNDYYSKREYWVSMTELLELLPFAQVKNIVQVIHRTGDHRVMLETSRLLLKNNVSVDPKDLENIAADVSYRLKLYDYLELIKKENLFPSKYLNPRKLSEGALVEYIEYEDETPEKLELVATKVVQYQDHPKENLYIFKYQLADDDKWYIGLSGPYPINSKKTTLRGDLTFNTYEIYDNKGPKLSEIIADALKDYEVKIF